MYAFNNTSYGNEQDPLHNDPTAELLVNQVEPTKRSGGYYQFSRNIFVPTEATAGNNFRKPVFAAGAYLQDESTELLSIGGNYFWQSNPGNSTSPGNPNTDVYVNHSHDRTSFPFGKNTYMDPGFANPGDLPTTAPRCDKFANTTDCMNGRYRIAASLAPSGNVVGAGYRPPRPCAPDPYFPIWLKGAVYLHWDGTGLTENSGLITKPCGM